MPCTVIPFTQTYVMVVPILHTPRTLSIHQRIHHTSQAWKPRPRAAWRRCRTASNAVEVTAAAGRLRRRMRKATRSNGKGTAKADASHGKGNDDMRACNEGGRRARIRWSQD
jgi:hypothetical protein